MLLSLRAKATANPFATLLLFSVSAFLLFAVSAFTVHPSSSSSSRIGRSWPCFGSATFPFPVDCCHSRTPSTLSTSRKRNEESEESTDDEDDSIDLSDKDWRAFRAKLVLSSSPNNLANSATTTTGSIASHTEEKGGVDGDLLEDDLDGIGSLFSGSGSALSRFQPNEHWAYNSGDLIETGAIILGGVEQDFGFGLRQQYFHKVAILVLEHEEGAFTRGIILNRPSDFVFTDDDKRWRIWFGGDVQGLGSSAVPEIVCLHSISGEQSEEVDSVSVTVMKDIKWTTFENAKLLVKKGLATPKDFWVFAGYAGWGPHQLKGELKRKSWYMVCTDSQTLLKELAKQSAYADPRDAGLDTWELLMNMIEKGDVAEECSGSFDDLMLKEWARESLLSSDGGGDLLGRKRLHPAMGVASTKELLETDLIDRILKRVSAAKMGEDVTVGSLVRASSAERSPFLLKKQEFHKSIVLVISDDENISVGVMLNNPAAKGMEMEIVEKETRKRRQFSIPLRFGGEYAVKAEAGAKQSPLLWLHCSPRLSAAKIGSPVGNAFVDGVWKCTQPEALTAIGNGLAKPNEFMIISGVSVWTKGEKGIARGIYGEVRDGRFEVIPSSRTKIVWDLLQEQEVLTNLNLMKNLAIGYNAWEKSSAGKNMKAKNVPVTDGIGEGYDEEDDSFVFKSGVKVSKLADDAHRSWVATFLLGAPGLGA